LFDTQEIGSLAKPAWRVKGAAGLPLSESEIREAEYWGEKLRIEGYRELVELLREPPSPERKEAIRRWSVVYAVKFLEEAGLDRVYTGEMLRVEMYEHPVRRLSGFRFLGRVQSLDNKYYRVASVVGRPARAKPIYLDEFLIAKSVARRELKVPVTGPYTLADWTLNDYYVRKALESAPSVKEAKRRARREFVFDIVDNVLRPELRDLVSAGATWIQVDEPAATTHPSREEMELFVEAFNRLTEGIPCKFSLHNCYSDYSVLAKYAPELKRCSQIALEFANRDLLKLGTRDEDRPGYSDLKLFVEHGYEGAFGVGVLHVHDYWGEGTEWAKVVNGTVIESPELVRDRLIYAAEVVGEPERGAANPDCGLRTRRDWKLVFEKLRNMVEGARLAREHFGG
jgi:5-methyltetrahydropteroyltriglutamate--homocysteine methyltransferase